MDYERVRLVLSIYTAIVGLFAILGLGKFFCVKILYDWYDEIDEASEGTLVVWMIAGIILEALALLFYYIQFKPLILISMFVICIVILICIVLSIVGLIIVSSRGLTKYHNKLKQKKNMR
jgi:hypothetical protein